MSKIISLVSQKIIAKFRNTIFSFFLFNFLVALEQFNESILNAPPKILINNKLQTIKSNAN